MYSGGRIGVCYLIIFSAVHFQTCGCVPPARLYPKSTVTYRYNRTARANFRPFLRLRSSSQVQSYNMLWYIKEGTSLKTHRRIRSYPDFSSDRKSVV